MWLPIYYNKAIINNQKILEYENNNRENPRIYATFFCEW